MAELEFDAVDAAAAAVDAAAAAVVEAAVVDDDFVGCGLDERAIDDATGADVDSCLLDLDDETEKRKKYITLIIITLVLLYYLY